VDAERRCDREGLPDTSAATAVSDPGSFEATEFFVVWLDWVTGTVAGNGCDVRPALYDFL